MLLGNVFQQLYNVVDSIIVGKVLGDQALGAVGANFPFIFALISFVVGIAIGATIGFVLFLILLFVVILYFNRKKCKCAS